MNDFYHTSLFISMKRKRKTKYNWCEIQKYYDDSHTWREVQVYFGVSTGAISNAIRRGDFSPRDKKSASKLAIDKGIGFMGHTQETKDKISKSRIKFLEENPDKVPYIINHSSKKSYPEKVFENALISSGIKGWEYNYRNGIYAYDFGFPKLKIDVEIDGGTHLTEKVKKIDSRRDEWSKSQGWKVIRFTAKEVKEDVISCISRLKEFM